VTTLDLAHNLYLAIAVLGLAISVGYAGQPVLCQGAFLAIGSFGVLHLERAGLPLGTAAAASVALAALAGYCVGLLVSRMHGATLALGTWALAWLADAVLRAFPGMSGGNQGLSRPTPGQVHSPFGFSFTLTPEIHVVGAGLLCAALVWMLIRLESGPAGLDLAALREAPMLARSLGIPVARRRPAVLAASAGLAGVAGVGTSVLLGVAGASDVSPLVSLQLFIAVLIGSAIRLPWGPLAGFLVVSVIPPVADDVASRLGLPPERLSAATTAVVLVAFLILRSRLGSSGASIPPFGGRAPEPLDQPDPPPPAFAEGQLLLAARNLSFSAGSRLILDGFDIQVLAGRISAVIGPNGSGKTTAIRILSGAIRPDRGSIEVGGAEVCAGHELDLVARGIARTFQHTSGFSGLNAYRQMRLGLRGGEAQPWAVLHDLMGTALGRRAERQHRAEALRILRLLGIEDQGYLSPARLDHATKRLLQIARIMGTGASVLLLDEPAAGMSASERQALVQVLRRLTDEGVGVLLVEHDLGLVSQVADTVTVLDRGRVLVSGPTAEVVADANVRRLYVGEGRPAGAQA
jgi:ABC-type branched-subunit amino acid transport system ATPase component/ABC-type branched-subunit amino acid transport system permease subunit